ncbi:MAG TPA: Uma2 family endonuclease [Longimicrobium sp.]|nr:Uma2 family endonuclease [Longimicrobium sp.]
MTTQPAVREWTYEEFARLPDDGNRYEVIAGELYVTPAPETPHQVVSGRFFLEMANFAMKEHHLGEVLYAPLDVLFGEGDYLEPDIVFLRNEHTHYRTRRAVEGPPDLIIEIVSRSTARQDRGIKRERYAHFGVPEYWIIDADRRRVEVYRLQEDPDRPTYVTDRLQWQPVEGGPSLDMNVRELLTGVE